MLKKHNSATRPRMRAAPPLRQGRWHRTPTNAMHVAIELHLLGLEVPGMIMHDDGDHDDDDGDHDDDHDDDYADATVFIGLFAIASLPYIFTFQQISQNLPVYSCQSIDKSPSHF